MATVCISMQNAGQCVVLCNCLYIWPGQCEHLPRTGEMCQSVAWGIRGCPLPSEHSVITLFVSHLSCFLSSDNPHTWQVTYREQLRCGVWTTTWKANILSDSVMRNNCSGVTFLTFTICECWIQDGRFPLHECTHGRSFVWVFSPYLLHAMNVVLKYYAWIF